MLGNAVWLAAASISSVAAAVGVSTMIVAVNSIWRVGVGGKRDGVGVGSVGA